MALTNQSSVELSLLTSEEWQKIREWNSTQVEYERHKCVHQLVEDQVERTPDQIAIAFENQQVTYQDLNQQANQLAHYLRFLGVGPDVLVGVCLERSIAMIIALLAVLKAGGAYVPLDTSYPLDRLRFILEDSRATVLLTQSHLVEALNIHNVRVVDLDNDVQVVAQHSSENLSSGVSPEHLAYVIYTSGSTGTPKGVAMPHRPLMNLLSWQQKDFGFSQARTLQFTPISFDVSFQEIFSTLSLGGTLVLIADSVRRNAEALLCYISNQAIERLFLPFVALQNLAEVAKSQTHLPIYLREVITAGEQLKITRSITEWFTQMQDCALYNHYGPSESHVVTAYKLSGSPKDWDYLPSIGKPITNVQIYLLDPNHQRKDDPVKLVPPGEPGEIAIEEMALARGYLNHSELEEGKFIPNPFSNGSGSRLYRTGDIARYRSDGNLEYIERIDNQVKIRGVRIELGEIEATLSQHPNIKDAVVIARDDSTGNKYLVAYYTVAASTASLTSHELGQKIYAFLKERLPKCLIPSKFMALDVFPFTPSGKVDRRSLPEPSPSRSILIEELVLPRTSLEAKFSEIWSLILGIEEIGIHDNFWDLGGNSLNAIQLISKIREVLQVDLPVAALFDAPTVAKLAEFVTASLNANATQAKFDEAVLQLETETKLELSIDPANSSVLSTVDPENIFITGVTGYLGAFLLHELLEKTQAFIYCLVRAETVEMGDQEIQNNLKKYFLWKETYKSRIVTIPGDLSQPLLGISEQNFLKLSRKIDVIYHNGAAISLIHPYSSLQATNVLGTRELLKLATQSKVKPFHFISTLDVFQTSGAFSAKLITENDELNAYEAVHFDGYTKSKWVSEKLVRNAHSLGLPVSIYRPAMITGHSQTGASNTGDLMNRLIKGFIQLASAPRFEMMINIAPVDYFSKGAIHLSRKSESLGKSFNFINPHPLPMSQFINLINDCGYQVQQVNHEKWEALLMAHMNNLDSIVSFLTSKPTEHSISYLERSSVGANSVTCHNVLSGLEDVSITCPVISADLLNTYFSYFNRIGFLAVQNKLDPLVA